MGCLQERVAAIQGVALAILLEGLAVECLPGEPATRVLQLARGVLVDVVAEEDERVDSPLLDEVAVGRVVPVLPVLAGREGEPEPLRGRACRCEGPGPPNGARPATGRESVVVDGVGFEPVDVGMYRMAERRLSRGDPRRNDLLQVRVEADHPGHLDVTRRQPDIGVEPRPEDHRVIEWVTRCDAECERVGRQFDTLRRLGGRLGGLFDTLRRLGGRLGRCRRGRRTRPLERRFGGGRAGRLGGRLRLRGVGTVRTCRGDRGGDRGHQEATPAELMRGFVVVHPWSMHSRSANH